MPDTLTGNSELVLDGSIPLYPSDFAGVLPTFRLTLTDFTSTAPIETRMIEDANLVLEGTAKQYTVKGEGTLDGLAASVDLVMGTEAPAQTAVTVTLDDEARERLGFGFGSLVTGPVQAALSNMADNNQAVSLDLKDANVNFPFLGWEKGPGVPATASFIMVKSEAGTELRELVVSGKGFEARGSLSIGADGRVKQMVLDHVSLRPGDQLSTTAIANGQGYDVVVRGSAFDARGIIAGVGDGLGGGSADIFPINIDLSIASVSGRNEVVLSDVAGSLTVTNKGLEKVSLKGNSDGNQPFEWTVGRDGDTRIMRVFADNGGALIGFSGVYGKAEGGNLVLDYSGPVGGEGSGALVMTDFSLIRETALEPALQTGSRARRHGACEPAIGRRGAFHPDAGALPTGRMGHHHQGRHAEGIAAWRDRRRHRQHSGRRYRDQRHVHSRLRREQHPRRHPAPWSDPRRRARRGSLRHQLQAFRPPRWPAAHDEPAFGHRARFLPKDLRISLIVRRERRAHVSCARPTA